MTRAIDRTLLREAVNRRRRRLAFIGAGLVVVFVVPKILGMISGEQSEYWPLTVATAACFGLVGLSINLLTGYAGQISLAQAALMGTGAYTLGNLTTRMHLPFFIGLAAAGLVSAVVALGIGFPALRIRGLNLAIVTLGFQFLMNRVVFRMKFLTGGSAGIDINRPIIFGVKLTRDYQFMYVIVLVVIAVFWLDRNVARSKLGRAFYAIREDESVASSFGIPVDRAKLMAFALAGFYAGLAGALFVTLTHSVSSEVYDYTQSLQFLVYAVIGGLGSPIGVFVSSMFPGIYTELLSGKEFGLHIGSFGFSIPSAALLIILGGLLLTLTLTRYRGGLAEQGAELRHIGKHLWHKARARGEEHAPPPKHSDVDVAEMLLLASANGSVPRHARPEHRVAAPLLAVADVSIRFGGVQALDGVDLEVREGEIVGLMGPNGAGKTTLFNCITGFAKPTAGKVLVRGEDVSDLPPHARAALGFGRTFQNIGLVKSQTVMQNLMIAQYTGASYTSLEGMLNTTAVQGSEAGLRRHARGILERLALDDIADQRCVDLPHGVLKMVELGCALVTDPAMLLLDEPGSGLSPQEADDLGGKLRSIQAEFDLTVLMIEHHVPLVLAVADYVYVLNFGRLLAEGDAREIAANPEVVSAYLGEAVVDA